MNALYVRPRTWHCVYCGEGYGPPNEYLCLACENVRPFAGGSSTMVGCGSCLQWSIGFAKHCEWCGKPI
ncbi:MAG: hypothetical protein ACYS22_08320 [Planctomycetota bacterium]